jgi:hypothetical protein
MKTKGKNAKKRLHRGKKIEAKKPLFVAVEHGTTTGTAPAPKPYLNINLNDVTVS